jgi:branched-chain amino acid transport system substrate-binding protein
MNARPLALIAFGLLVLSAAPAAAQAPKEVVIGVLYPQTGNLAQLGIDSVIAIKMATDIINNGTAGAMNLPLGKTPGLPGLGGAKIRLVIVDHQGKPEVAQGEAERLIAQEKVHAIIGAVHSSVTATASQVAERYGLPFFNAESSSPTLTERGFKWFFRSSPHDGHFTQVMFEFMRDFEKKRGIKIKTLGIMHEDTLFGADSAKVQEALARQFGYEIVVKMAYRNRTTSLDAEVAKLKAANPDVFLPTSYTTDAVLYLKTARNLDYNPRMLIAQNAGWIDPQFVAEMGKEAEGNLTRSPFALDLAARKPLIKPVNELFKKQPNNPNGRDISEAPMRGFTGFMVLADAINRAKSVAPEEIRKALVATNMPADQLVMPWSGVRFDEKGQNVGVRAILMQMQGGSYKTVYPFDLASADVIYPIPAWKERK